MGRKTENKEFPLLIKLLGLSETKNKISNNQKGLLVILVMKITATNSCQEIWMVPFILHQ